VLLVGGTGILAPAARTLVARGVPVVVVTRDRARVDAAIGASPLVTSCVVDAADAAAWPAAVAAQAAAAPLTEAVVYLPFPTAGPLVPVAAAVTGTVVGVLTSGAADPSGRGFDVPVGGPPPCTRVLLLGWHDAGARARWHTPEEVSAAALDVLAGAGAPRPAARYGITGVDVVHTLGRLQPWAGRPSH